VLAPAAVGVTASWIESAPGWDNETQVAHYGTTVFKQNGRYIFSFRGGATNTLDVYDIAANTWVSGLAYGNQQETFTTGSSAADISGAIYIAKEASGRVFAFDVARNRLLPLTTNTTQAALGGTAVVGDKLFFLPYRDGTTTINYMYMMRHSGAELVRMLLI
jgi:hypothetical protein